MFNKKKTIKLVLGPHALEQFRMRTNTDLDDNGIVNKLNTHAKYGYITKYVGNHPDRIFFNFINIVAGVTTDVRNPVDLFVETMMYPCGEYMGRAKKIHVKWDVLKEKVI